MAFHKKLLSVAVILVVAVLFLVLAIALNENMDPYGQLLLSLVIMLHYGPRTF